MASPLQEHIMTHLENKTMMPENHCKGEIIFEARRWPHTFQIRHLHIPKTKIFHNQANKKNKAFRKDVNNKVNGWCSRRMPVSHQWNLYLRAGLMLT